MINGLKVQIIQIQGFLYANEQRMQKQIVNFAIPKNQPQSRTRTRQQVHQFKITEHFCNRIQGSDDFERDFTEEPAINQHQRTNTREAQKILNNGKVGDGHIFSFSETQNSAVSLSKLGGLKGNRGSNGSEKTVPFIPELTHNNLEKFMKMQKEARNQNQAALGSINQLLGKELSVGLKPQISKSSLPKAPPLAERTEALAKQKAFNSQVSNGSFSRLNQNRSSGNYDVEEYIKNNNLQSIGVPSGRDLLKGGRQTVQNFNDPLRRQQQSERMPKQRPSSASGFNDNHRPQSNRIVPAQFKNEKPNQLGGTRVDNFPRQLEVKQQPKFSRKGDFQHRLDQLSSSLININHTNSYSHQLRQSEKVITHNQRKKKQNTKLNLSAIHQNTQSRHQRSQSPPERALFDSSNTFISVNKTKKQRKPSRDKIQQSVSSNKMLAAQSRKMSKPANSRAKTSMGNTKPPSGIATGGSTINKAAAVQQFQEFLDGGLKQASISTVSKHGSGAQHQGNTTLNILTASNTVAIQNNNSPGIIQKKQQKMLQKKLKQNQQKRSRSRPAARANSTLGVNPKGSGNMANFLEVPQPKQKKVKRPSSGMGRQPKNNLTPRKTHVRLPVHNQSSIGNSSNKSMREMRHSSEKMSNGRTMSRMSQKSSNTKKRAARSTSGGNSGTGRRTVECLLADNLRNSSNGIVQHQPTPGKGNDSQTNTSYGPGQSEPVLASVLQRSGLVNLLVGPQDAQILTSTQQDEFRNVVGNQAQRHSQGSGLDQHINRHSLKVQSVAVHSYPQTATGKTKLDKLIKRNLKRYKAQVDESKHKQEVKEEQLKLKKARLDEQNQRVRTINNASVQRRKQQTTQASEMANNRVGDFNISQQLQQQNSVDMKSDNQLLARTDHMRNQKRPKTQLKLGPSPNRQESLDADSSQNQTAHRRSNFGLDFLEVRKEINAEIKKRGDLKITEPRKAKKLSQRVSSPATMESQANRMATKFNIGSNLSGISTLNMGSTTNMKSHSPSQQQSQGQSQAITGLTATAAFLAEIDEHEEPPLVKREKVRKFMKAKQRQAVTQKELVKAQELKNAQQVAENLLKLNRYIGKKNKPSAHGGSLRETSKGKGSTLRQAGNRRKNMSILHHNLGPAENGRKPSKRLELNVPNPGHQQEQTPGKQLLYENSEHSQHEGRRRGRAADDLYEESKMGSLGTTLPAERGVSQSAVTNNPRKVLQPAIQQSTTSATIAAPLNSSLVTSKKEGRKKTSGAAAAYFEHSDRGSSGEMKQEFNKRVGRPNLTIKPSQDSRFDSNSNGRSAIESTEDLPDSRIISKAQMMAQKTGKRPNAGVRKPTPRKGDKSIVIGGKGQVESRISNDRVFFGNRKSSRDNAKDTSTLNGGGSRASEPAIASGTSLPRGGDGYLNQLNGNVSRGTLGTSGSRKKKKRKNSLSSASQRSFQASERGHEDVYNRGANTRPFKRISFNLSRENAATHIQRIMRGCLARGGFYQRQLRSIGSPDKEPLIDISIAQRKRVSPPKVEERKRMQHSPGQTLIEPEQSAYVSLGESNKDLEVPLIRGLGLVGDSEQVASAPDIIIALPQQKKPKYKPGKDIVVPSKQRTIPDDRPSSVSAYKEEESMRDGGLRQPEQSPSSFEDRRMLPHPQQRDRGQMQASNNSNSNHVKSATQLERVEEMVRPPKLRGLDPDEEYHGLGDSRHKGNRQQHRNPLVNAISGVEALSSQNSELLQPSQFSADSKSSMFDGREHPNMFLGQEYGPGSLSNLAQQAPHTQSQHSIDSLSQKSSNSLFDRNSFQNFSRKKLIYLMQNNEYQQLIKVREDWIYFRERKEKRALRKSLKSNELSANDYQAKRDRIERWVHVQKEDILKTKMVYQQEWDKTVQMIEDTQKQTNETKQKIHPNGGSNGKFRSASSIGPGMHFGAQSTSEAALSIGHVEVASLGGNYQHIGRSALIDDPPKSYRSGKQELPSRIGMPMIALPADGKSDEVGVRSQRGLLVSNVVSPKPPTGLNKLTKQKTELDPIDVGDISQHEPSQSLLDKLEKAFTGSVESGSVMKSNLGQDRVFGLQELDRLLSGGDQDQDPDGAAADDQDKQFPTITEEQTGHFVPPSPFDKSHQTIDINPEKEVLPFDGDKESAQEPDVLPTEQKDDQFEQIEPELVSIVTDNAPKFEEVPDPILKETDGDLDFDTPAAAHRATHDHTIDEMPQPGAVKVDENLLKELQINSSPSEDIKQQIAAEDLKSPVSPGSNVSEPAIITGTTTFEPSTDVADTTQSEKPSTLDSLVKSMWTTDGKKGELADMVTEEVYQDILKELYWDFPPVRKDLDEKPEKTEEEKEREANQDVYVLDLSHGQKEERREWIEHHHRHLIERELFQSDQYITEVLERLLMYEIDSDEDSDESETDRQARLKLAAANSPYAKESPLNLHIQFLQALTQPIVRAAKDVLKQLGSHEEPQYAHFETCCALSKFPIMPVDLYLDVERQRDEDDQADHARLREQLNSSAELSVIQESVHIQNKCYFDALNESLMKFRPYGITGEPMPWSTKVRRLQTKVDINSVDTERLFQMVKHDVFRWSSAFCGILPSNDFMFTVPGRSAKKQKQFNDELFQETRDKRLSQVLQAETVEQEHHWLNFEYEEAQVRTDLSDMVLESLINELVGFLGKREGIEPPSRKPTCTVEEVKDDKDEVNPAFMNTGKDSMFGDMKKYSSQQAKYLQNEAINIIAHSRAESKDSAQNSPEKGLSASRKLSL